MASPRRSASPASTIALICLPIFIGALDLTVVSAVLPHVILDLEIPLQTGLDDAAWIVTGYLLAYSISMTFMGRLSDLHGRRRAYLASLAIFALGSYLVASADSWPTRLALRLYYLVASGRPDPSFVSLWTLVAARMVQAFGGGAMVPVGMALVGDLYPPERRARPLGVIAAVDTAGWVVGHLYGGILVRFWNWRTIFWLNLPICLLAFLLIFRRLRPQVEASAAARMDWAGAALITAALALLIIGLGSGGEGGQAAFGGQREGLPEYGGWLIAVAALLALGFVWRQSRAAEPLLRLSLFRSRNFSAAGLANFLTGFSLFIAIANVPLFINTLVAATPAQGAWDSGWMLSALTVPMAVAAIPGGWLTERRGYRATAAMGLLLAILGFALMTRWRATTPYAHMAPHLVLAGVGFGLTLAPVAAAVVNSASADQRGAASSLVILFRLVGMTAGVSSITTYGLRRADVLTAQLLPAGASLAETARIGMRVAEQVIGETFLIAGAICTLALVPVLLLRTAAAQREDHDE
jgi:MFS family permease